MDESKLQGRKGYKRGRWGAFYVMVRKPHHEAIMGWAKQSGMSRAAFFRAALLRGALEMARGLGVADSYPELDD